MKTVTGTRYFAVDTKSNPVLDSKGNIIFGKTKKAANKKAIEELSVKDLAKITITEGIVTIP